MLGAIGAQAAPPPAPESAGARSPEAGKAAAQAYGELQKKAYSSALALYEQALAGDPERPELWNEYAICLRNLRRLPAAAKAGWRALQLDGGKTPQLWNAQANTLIEAREWKAAQACLEKVETLHQDRPFVARAWLNLAFRMLAAGSNEGLVDICRRATRLDPGNSLGWIDLGQVQACTGADIKDIAASLDKGQALARAQKDGQRADYADQLLKKVKAGESVRPPATAGQSWQTLPAALLRKPEADARQVALPALVDHHYVLADGSVLSLSVPETWAESFGKDRPENQFSVHFTQPGTERFKVLFSPFLGDGNPLGVQATAKGVAQDLLPGSVEKELPLHPLTSPTMTGWWVLSTNKKATEGGPAKGEFRHLVSLQLEVTGQQCVGTVLTNSKAPEVLDPCLALFSSARRAAALKN
jgi:Tfp pilus assembly protein PilF